MLHETIVREKIQKALGNRDELTIYDSWTPELTLQFEPQKYAKMDRERLAKLFTSTRAALRNVDTLWLTRDTHWLDKDHKYTLEAPQTAGDTCGFRLKTTRAHEEDARRNPLQHGRLDGSIIMAKADTHTLLATVRLGGEAAATVQLRREPVTRQGKPGTTVHLLAYLGTREQIDFAVSKLAGFLRDRSYVEAAMRRVGKAKDAYHRSHDPLLLEHRGKGSIDTLDAAGCPGSPERLRWSVGAGLNNPRLRFARGWAQPQLPQLKAG